MIIQVINIMGILANKPENDPVITAFFHRPKTCQIACQLVQVIAGHIHIGNGYSLQM